MSTVPQQRRIVAGLDALQAEVDALKRLQAETAAELDALVTASRPPDWSVFKNSVNA